LWIQDGKKAYASSFNSARRKPGLRKALAAGEMPACVAPVWQRDPARATFDPVGEPKFSFSVRSRSVDLIQDEESAEE
jgi:hypothetical protein